MARKPLVVAEPTPDVDPFEDEPESAANFAPEVSKHPGAKVFAAIAAKSASFRQVREVIQRVRAVPTIFPHVDHRIRVGGWPTDRVAFVLGPSGMGKTKFVQGIGHSFIKRGHLFNFVDAEMATPISFLRVLHKEYIDSPAFLASRPSSYEQVVDDTRVVANGLKEARDKGKIEDWVTGLFAIDSLRKLVPEDIQERIKKMGAEGDKGSIDGFGGAAGRMRAALNAAWLDELVPLMYNTGCGIILIGRESEDPTADARDRMYGNDWKPQGGKSVIYDSSLVVRVARAAPVLDGEEFVGEKHKVEIRKTKVSGRQDTIEIAYFHTSNGKRSPEGFDRARDLLLLGVELGVIKKVANSSWISFAGHRFQGEARFAEKADAALLDELDGACREKFGEGVEERAEVLGE